MTNEEEIRRGMEAERLMAEPMLKEAFEKTEAAIVDALRRCDLKKDDEAKTLALSLQLLGQIKGHFKTTMETGKMARIQKETMTDKAKRLFRV
jgi:hypothetical protein